MAPELPGQQPSAAIAQSVRALDAPQRRAAFVRTRDWPAANERVYRALQQQLPDYRIDLIELEPLIKRLPLVIALNLFWMAWYYGLDMLRRRRKPKDCFFRTPYIFHAIKRVVAQQITKEQYDFSFQMQSLFDASTPGTPHFLYTDHTHLANLHYADFDQRLLYNKRWIALERTIYQNTAINFCRSSNIRQSLIDQYSCDPSKVVRVYAGSNTDQQSIAFNEDKYRSKNILFVGIDWQRKGGPMLVKAFEQVRATHPDAQLTIVGCTPQIDVLGCRVVGKIPIQQVSAFYEQAAIFCLPTKIEPFGVVFVEAMSHKLPLVAPNVGAVPDFVLHGETGYLIELGDVAALAQALIVLLDDPQRCRTMGENGYALVKRYYSWDSVAMAMRSHILTAVHRTSNELQTN